jgi:hypothetical protein
MIATELCIYPKTQQRRLPCRRLRAWEPALLVLG